jgi:hypothetical protein
MCLNMISRRVHSAIISWSRCRIREIRFGIHGDTGRNESSFFRFCYSFSFRWSLRKGRVCATIWDFNARCSAELWDWKYVRFEVFAEVTMRNAVFWDFTPCGSCKNLRFGGKYRVRHQSGRNQRARNVSSNKQLKHAAKVIFPFQTSVLITATRRHIPEDSNRHCRGKLKSYTANKVAIYIYIYIYSLMQCKFPYFPQVLCH